MKKGNFNGFAARRPLFSCGLLCGLLAALAGSAGCGGEDAEEIPLDEFPGDGKGPAKDPTKGNPAEVVDGEYSSDIPPPFVKAGPDDEQDAMGNKLDDKGNTIPNCTADYDAGGRNPGLVKLDANRTFSFYKDRAGAEPIAEGCVYAYKGYRGDPHYYGPVEEGKSPSSVWTIHELESGGPACEAQFKYVILRPPHGDGNAKHMHARFGGSGTTVDGLLQMSVGDYEDTDPCDPWWSLYCIKGVTGCDG